MLYIARLWHDMSVYRVFVCLTVCNGFLRAKAATAFSSFWPSQFCLSVCPSVCPSVKRVDQSKTVQARITKFLPLAARKTLVSGTVKLFRKFERCHPEGGR